MTLRTGRLSTLTKDLPSKPSGMIDKKTGVIISFPDGKSPVASVPMRNFPLELWREWDADCKVRFGDSRWVKAWNDHQRAKALDMLESNAFGVKEAMVAEATEKEESESDEGLGLMKGDD